MDSFNEKPDFSKLSSIVFANYMDHVATLRKNFISKSISHTAFLETVQQGLKDRESPSNSSNELETIAEYSEMFKILDEYPKNLQKIPKKRELQRTNSVLKVNSADLTELSQSSTTLNMSTLASLTQLDSQKSAREVYLDFKQFQQKMRQVYEEIDEIDKLKISYNTSIEQLKTFANQLEKLLPVHRVTENAFTPSEIDTLVSIGNELEQLNSVRALDKERNDNSSISATNGSSATSRLESVVDVLTYTLLELNCFNNL